MFVLLQYSIERRACQSPQSLRDSSPCVQGGAKGKDATRQLPLRARGAKGKGATRQLPLRARGAKEGGVPPCVIRACKERSALSCPPLCVQGRGRGGIEKRACQSPQSLRDSSPCVQGEPRERTLRDSSPCVQGEPRERTLRDSSPCVQGEPRRGGYKHFLYLV